VHESGIPRDELFVTTKLWNNEHGYDEALRAFDARPGTAWVGVRRPVPDPLAGGRQREVPGGVARACQDQGGRQGAVGRRVELPPGHLTRLIDETGIVPSIDQVELHPYLAQAPLRAFNAERSITTEAWSPLGQGKGLLDDPALAPIAAAHGKSPAQVALRWHLQLGNVVIPQVGDPGADQGEHRRVRLRTHRRRHRGDRPPSTPGAAFGPNPDTMAWLG